MRKWNTYLLPAAFVAAFGLLAAGCPCTHPHVENAGSQARPCGCEGACKGDCKRYRHRKRGHGGHFAKMAKKRLKMMRKIKRMGAPKLLCGMKLKRHAKLLGLTQDQLNKLAAIQKAARASGTDLKVKLKQATVALKAEWLNDQPDGAKIQQLATTLLGLVEQKIKAKMMASMQRQKVLTAQQWKRVRASRGHRGGMGYHGKRGFRGKRCGCEGPCKCAKKACGCKGPCKCKGMGYAGKGGRGKKCGKHCVMKKAMKLGSPKLLCPKMLFGHAKMLGLTADQRAQLKTLMKGMINRGVDGRIACKRSFLQLKLEWLADQPDQAKLGNHGQTFWKNVKAKILGKLAMRLAIQKILTADQWKKIRTARGHRMGGKGCKGNCKGCKSNCKGCKGNCKGCKGYCKGNCRGGCKGRPCKTGRGPSA